MPTTITANKLTNSIIETNYLYNDGNIIENYLESSTISTNNVRNTAYIVLNKLTNSKIGGGIINTIDDSSWINQITLFGDITTLTNLNLSTDLTTWVNRFFHDGNELILGLT